MSPEAKTLLSVGGQATTSIESLCFQLGGPLEAHALDLSITRVKEWLDAAEAYCLTLPDCESDPS